MSFGNTSVYPFPAVQYIPMSITEIISGNLDSSIPIRTQIIAGLDLLQWRPILQRDFAVEIPELFLADSFPVLAFQLQVIDVKYRGYFVTMLGRKKPGYYQLFTLPKRYFYKQKLCFELYEENSGKPLARYSLFMDNKKSSLVH